MLEADSDEIRNLEERLLHVEVRRDTRELSEIVHPDFVEFGISGTIWDRDEILARLPSHDQHFSPIRDFKVGFLSADVALATYRIEIALGAEAPQESLRSSIWVREAGSWRVRFHQGTTMPSQAT